jgi:hypothetical protein
VHHNVGAQLKGTLQRRRQKRIVHTDFDTVRVGDAADRRNVSQHHERIARRFNVHQLCVRLHRRFHRCQVARIDILDLDAIPADDLVKQPDRSGVDVA